MPHVIPPKDPPIQCVLDLAKLIKSGEAVEKKDWVFVHGYSILGYVGRLTFGVPPEVDAGMLAEAEQPTTLEGQVAACEELKAAIVETVPPEGAEQGVLDGFWKYLYEAVLPKILEWLDHLKGEQSPA